MYVFVVFSRNVNVFWIEFWEDWWFVVFFKGFFFEFDFSSMFIMVVVVCEVCSFIFILVKRGMLLIGYLCFWICKRDFCRNIFRVCVLGNFKWIIMRIFFM